MPGWRIVLAAVLGGAALFPLRANAVDAHDLITHCAETSAAHTRGLAAVRSVCPGIDQAAASLRMGTLLPPDWDQKASPTTLADLEALAERYAGRPPSSLPAASDLRAVALRLQQPEPASSSASVWARIKGWLQHRLAPAAQLLKWLFPKSGRTAGPGLQQVLLVAVIILLLLGIAAFVMVAVRAAGNRDAGGSKRSETRRRRAALRAMTAAPEVGNADPATALDRPVLALQVLIEALRHSRRIEKDGNLTCREVITRAVFDTQRQREGFARIALLAERELYGPRGATIRLPDELRPALQGLCAQLSAAPAIRSAAS